MKALAVNHQPNGWDDFYSGISGNAHKLLVPKTPEIIRAAPFEHASNIIEWVTDRRFLNVPSVIDTYTRQYQIMRDVFQLRCPICNSMRPEAVDCWGKTRMELESELLLVWNQDLRDLQCPKCRTTRKEFEVDGLLQRIDTMVGVSGMRCVDGTTSVVTKEFGQIEMVDLYRRTGASYRHDTFTRIPFPLHLWDGAEYNLATHIYFAGTEFGKEIQVGYRTLMCSDIHPLMTRNGWVEAAHLRVGTEVQTDEGWFPINKIKKTGYKRSLYDFHIPTTHRFMANGILSHNSGKSVLEGFIGTFIEHECAVIGDLHKYFGILDGDTLQMSFVATTATQAEETVYTKYRAARASSPWMQKYVAWVKEQEKIQRTPIGMQRWEYKEIDSEVDNPLLRLSIKSLNSNSAGLAGATRIAAFIDELSRFDTTDSKRSAGEIVKVMNQGLKTIRGSRDRQGLQPFWGFFGATSSPISVDDETMRMVKVKISGQYSFHYPTWEFNPDLPRSQFNGDFERDPIGAMRDFGAQPPNAETPYIEDESRFRRIIDYTIQPTALFKKFELEDKTGHKYVAAKLLEARLDTVNTHFLHFDAGESFDTFAGASAHGEWVEIIDPASKTKAQKWVTVFDWVLGIQPIPGKSLEDRRIVYFDAIVEIIADLIKRQKISRVTFDRWNSVKLLQDIRTLGVHTDKQSIGYQEFIDFSKSSYDGRIRFLGTRGIDEPTDPHLKYDHEKAIYELLRLERSKDLKRIYNPKKGRRHGENSDDLAQAVVGAHIGVQMSQVAISDSHSLKEVLKREQVGGSAYERTAANGQTGGRIARVRRW